MKASLPMIDFRHRFDLDGIAEIKRSRFINISHYLKNYTVLMHKHRLRRDISLQHFFRLVQKVCGKVASTGLHESFETHRQRAAELRANGLIEYGNKSDANAVHGEEGAKKLDAKLKVDAEMREILKNSWATPLVNPEIKMAERPADTSKHK